MNTKISIKDAYEIAMEAFDEVVERRIHLDQRDQARIQYSEYLLRMYLNYTDNLSREFPFEPLKDAETKRLLFDSQ